MTNRILPVLACLMCSPVELFAKSPMEELCVISAPDGGVVGVLEVSDTRCAILFSNGDVRVYNSVSGKVVSRSSLLTQSQLDAGDVVRSIAISPDGAEFAMLLSKGGCVSVVMKDWVVTTITKHDPDIDRISYDSDCEQYVITANDSIRLIDKRSRKQVRLTLPDGLAMRFKKLGVAGTYYSSKASVLAVEYKPGIGDDNARVELVRVNGRGECTSLFLASCSGDVNSSVRLDSESLSYSLEGQSFCKIALRRNGDEIGMRHVSPAFVSNDRVQYDYHASVGNAGAVYLYQHDKSVYCATSMSCGVLFKIDKLAVASILSHYSIQSNTAYYLTVYPSGSTAIGIYRMSK